MHFDNSIHQIQGSFVDISGEDNGGDMRAAG